MQAEQDERRRLEGLIRSMKRNGVGSGSGKSSLSNVQIMRS